ncbi:MAG: ABC transporter ATP-binding protein [Coriobacteriales bacterium]|jgi:sodium transport system ATP-binding protein|nr:ABC transporter ATP-binding protein [Coriobacteriales bacterium]
MLDIIKADRLCKTFKVSAKQRRMENITATTHVAVDNLSFTAQPGEIYGLLGPNGAGKTTTLRMLATLIKPDSGDAIVAGRSIVNEPSAVRAAIGFLTSELKLEDYFTPNYLFDFFANLHAVPPEAAAKNKQLLFERFEISEFANVKVAYLSTGMKQKASLAISLAHDPGIIIFDEPTNGLDVITAKTVTDYLQDLRASGKTIILSTHIFSLVQKLCNRVGIIIDGRMITEGTLSEVCNGMDLENKFFELYVQTKGGSNTSTDTSANTSANTSTNTSTNTNDNNVANTNNTTNDNFTHRKAV